MATEDPSETIIGLILRGEIPADGYRVGTNIGRWGGQSVDHLHFHAVGGRRLR